MFWIPCIQAVSLLERTLIFNAFTFLRDVWYFPFLRLFYKRRKTLNLQSGSDRGTFWLKTCALVYVCFLSFFWLRMFRVFLFAWYRRERSLFFASDFNFQVFGEEKATCIRVAASVLHFLIFQRPFCLRGCVTNMHDSLTIVHSAWTSLVENVLTSVFGSSPEFFKKRRS